MADKLMKFSEAVKKYDPVIGLETHVELSTNTKLFCPAHVEFGGEPNTQLTPVSLGLPGSLPVVNKAAVDYAIKLGLALHCEINEWSQFARKNYFYPDMPRDYQISQYDKPTNGNGYLDVELDDGTIFRVPIERAHIEDDAGKNTHIGGADGRIEGADHSLVDYNRAGVPLIEIVTKPIEGVGARAAEIAGAYMRTLRDIVRALNISHARMEQGNMRADVNVSLRPSPDDPYGTRSETKNVNSFRGIEKTITYEIRRQAARLDEGKEILQETRHWDESTQTTAGGRVKTDADDYRYFPDPDLVMLHITKEHIEEMKAQMPEMPRERRNRLQKEWNLTDLQMRDIINADALDLIEETVKAGAKAAGARKWWLGEISRAANAKEVSLEELPITPADVAEVEKLIASGKLNDKLAKQTVAGVLAGEGTPAEVVKKHGYQVVEDTGAIEKAVDDALAANPDVFEKLKSGNMKPMGVIIGAVMKATRGQADAKAVTKIVMSKVKG
ncbi:Asp-tRNA(Asn)/Glu-tRNA(Gln) amidotransferase subunit GatB [Bifidobacterium simiarum]|uniref:Aspartyl/glutamyl-tRNA(Asn/Gln) amidotransferase subunit B n=1 Tax=Bifidobacterium simiarum TaxID=2045441 RepID=A0A2M9HF62_9BIFI|nr:Asp-tRNA(Asn)/Glu-tRNA(Gln) amidotransferase subunit GatB [Bifidobacterium simiarum]PJM75441.1 Asp-tRNA(Asn)/Glu-tRNA(Gln) amidotransferase GatCAB subunit B [Bifidobacterium simiarum]